MLPNIYLPKERKANPTVPFQPQHHLTVTSVVTVSSMPHHDKITFSPHRPGQPARLEPSASQASMVSTTNERVVNVSDRRSLTAAPCTDYACKHEQCRLRNEQRQRKWYSGCWNGLTRKWMRLFQPVMKSSHPAPGPSAGWFRQVGYEMMLPPTGIAARLVTLAMLAFFIWAAFWSVLTKDMLPHGNIFGLYMVVLFALILGYLVERIKLAPLLGMLIVGCFMRNVPPLDFTKYVDKTWSSSIRNLALTVILTRAGLGLDQVALQKRFWAIMSLAVVPTFAITGFITVVAVYMLDFPWLHSAALGFLISAVSPAVIVPIMLVFQEQKLGTVKGLPSMIIAAATICDVIAICGNGILLGIALSNGSLAFNIAAAPIQIVVGIGFGILVGWILVYFPSGDDNAATIFRFILLLCSGVLCIFGSKIANLSGAGALGALTTPMVAVRGWKRKGYTNSVFQISTALRYCWVICQPLLFGLIGAAVDFSTLRPQRVGLIIGLLISAHVFQFFATLAATWGFRAFTWREHLFLAFGFLPKATIQAAIGSNALDIAMKNNLGDDMITLGRDTLNCAVLAIVFMAPIGGVLLMLTGPKLLDKEPLLPVVTMEEKAAKEEDDEPSSPPYTNGMVQNGGSQVEIGGIVNGSFEYDRDMRRRSGVSIQLQNLDNRRGSKSQL
ncbi:Mitochondrial sodium/hydrogen exchanger 9B2 [Hypsibius exemplaris]|uniref:Mitochondrial sodium/hydrogen exchanger 9B2 n=1 Tax=Hypsibius exemplaris TaxID=2072580 RepID=A0A1W0XFG2_HYPEX|nr:Mitochondrial sodium/hydrogen exchanger 9B2 [Hypsibius exemplaris]